MKQQTKSAINRATRQVHGRRRKSRIRVVAQLFEFTLQNSARKRQTFLANDELAAREAAVAQGFARKITTLKLIQS
jgi:hypothetical protein